MPQFLIQSITSVKGGVMRQFIVEGSDMNDAIQYFKSVLPYPNPRLRTYAIADDSLIPDFRIDSRILEIETRNTIPS